MLNELLVTESGKSGFIPRLVNDAFFPDFFRPYVYKDKFNTWPEVDIREYKNRFVIHADVPGVNQEDIKIEVLKGELVLQGVRQEHEDSKENAEDQSTLLLSERPAMSFKRTFALGDEIQVDQIEATYKNGILTVVLPKAEKVVPRVIPIHVKNK